MSLTQAQIAAMDEVELLGRCALKLGIRSHSGMAWSDAGSPWFYREWLFWLLCPVVGNPNPRYVVCHATDSGVDTDWQVSVAALANAGVILDPQTWQEGCRAALAAWSGV